MRILKLRKNIKIAVENIQNCNFSGKKVFPNSWEVEIMALVAGPLVEYHASIFRAIQQADSIDNHLALMAEDPLELRQETHRCNICSIILPWDCIPQTMPMKV